MASLLVIAARCFASAGEVSLFGVDDIPLNATWVFFAAGTVIHAFTARFLIQHLEANPPPYDLKAENSLYDDICAEAGYFVSVEVRRVRVDEYGESVRFVRMSTTDPSTWVAYGSALAVWIALLPWWRDDGLQVGGIGQLVATTMVATLLVILNWLIGSHWALAISSLGHEDKESFFPGLPAPSSGSPQFAAGVGCLALLVLALLVAVVLVGHSHLGI